MSLSVRIVHSFGAFGLDLDFSAPPGITVLFGRSGSGKTSVIHAVAGLLRPQQACIAIDGQVLVDTGARIWVPPHRRRVGVVFQESRLFPHLSVAQNLQYGRRLAPPDAHLEPWDRVIDLLGIGHLLGRRPRSLSGGEQQRVAIGRALLAGPRLLLADEPLASLDEARKVEILETFARLRDELAIPIVYVSHSPTEVARLATTVVVLDEGRVRLVGSAVDVLGDPMITPLGVRAVGAVIEATVAAHHEDGLSELAVNGQVLFLPRVPQAVGERLRVRVPAQDVMIALERPQGISALNILPGSVESIRDGDGPGVIVSLRTPAGRVLARITRRSAKRLALVAGAQCHAVVKTVAIAPEDVGRGR
ncbi:MAG: molybdenum ABC transporter ATP-binding protein [Burkholderiaceae bacterium]